MTPEVSRYPRPAGGLFLPDTPNSLVERGHVEEDTPNSLVDVEEDTPNSLVDVEEDTPNSLVDVEEGTPNSLVDVEEDTPNSLVDVEEDTPNSLVERGHVEGGRRVLEKTRGTSKVDREFNGIVAAHEATKNMGSPWLAMLRRENLPFLALAM